MSPNDPAVEAVLATPCRTKHHVHRDAASPGTLDWATQPDPFRTFGGADRVELSLLVNFPLTVRKVSLGEPARPMFVATRSTLNASPTNTGPRQTCPTWTNVHRLKRARLSDRHRLIVENEASGGHAPSSDPQPGQDWGGKKSPEVLSPSWVAETAVRFSTYLWGSLTNIGM
jgi:hypothetical protein